MNAKFYSVTNARKLAGNETATLDPIKAEALVYVQDVGLSATAREAGKQAWSVTAGYALTLQPKDGQGIKDLPERLIAFKGHTDAVLAELRGAAIAELVKDAGWHKDVKEGRSKDDAKTPLTRLQSVMAKAQAKMAVYASIITSAWNEGLLIKADSRTDGSLIPEAVNKLRTRTTEAKEGKAVVTADSLVKRAWNSLAGGMAEVADSIKTTEQADILVKLATAIGNVSLHFANGTISASDLLDGVGYFESLIPEAPKAEETPTLTDIPQGLGDTQEAPADTEAADEVREELAIG